MCALSITLQLHLAAYRGHPEVVKVLLASKGDPTIGNGALQLD